MITYCDIKDLLLEERLEFKRNKKEHLITYEHRAVYQLNDLLLETLEGGFKQWVQKNRFKRDMEDIFDYFEEAHFEEVEGIEPIYDLMIEVDDLFAKWEDVSFVECIDCKGKGFLKSNDSDILCDFCEGKGTFEKINGPYPIELDKLTLNFYKLCYNDLRGTFLSIIVSMVEDIDDTVDRVLKMPRYKDYEYEEIF